MFTDNLTSVWGADFDILLNQLLYDHWVLKKEMLVVNYRTFPQPRARLVGNHLALEVNGKIKYLVLVKQTLGEDGMWFNYFPTLCPYIDYVIHFRNEEKRWSNQRDDFLEFKRDLIGYRKKEKTYRVPGSKKRKDRIW